MQNMMQAFILLLAGFLVVFSVLILLIVVVTLYSKIIRAAQNAGEKKKAKKQNEDKQESAENNKVRAVTRAEIEDDDGEIPGEIVAVIAAAVDAVYGEKPHKIKSVRKSRPARSAWARAGILQNTRPF